MQYFISSSILIEILIIVNNNFYHVFPHQTTDIYSRSLVKTECLLCKHSFQTSPLSQISKFPFSDSFYYTEIDSVLLPYSNSSDLKRICLRVGPWTYLLQGLGVTCFRCFLKIIYKWPLIVISNREDLAFLLWIKKRS